MFTNAKNSEIQYILVDDQLSVKVWVWLRSGLPHSFFSHGIFEAVVSSVMKLT